MKTLQNTNNLIGVEFYLLLNIDQYFLIASFVKKSNWARLDNKKYSIIKRS